MLAFTSARLLRIGICVETFMKQVLCGAEEKSITKPGVLQALLSFSSKDGGGGEPHKPKVG
jgi:hypothetical protein